MRLLPRLRLKLSVRGPMLLIAGFALGIGADRFYIRFNLCMGRAAHYEARREELLRQAAHLERYKDDNFIINGTAVRLKRLGPYIRSSRSEAAKARRSEAAKAESLRSQFIRAAYWQVFPLPPGRPDGIGPVNEETPPKPPR